MKSRMAELDPVHAPWTLGRPSEGGSGLGRSLGRLPEIARDSQGLTVNSLLKSRMAISGHVTPSTCSLDTGKAFQGGAAALAEASVCISVGDEVWLTLRPKLRLAASGHVTACTRSADTEKALRGGSILARDLASCFRGTP